jgi:hypothetical protein
MDANPTIELQVRETDKGKNRAAQGARTTVRGTQKAAILPASDLKPGLREGGIQDVGVTKIVIQYNLNKLNYNKLYIILLDSASYLNNHRGNEQEIGKDIPGRTGGYPINFKMGR